MSARISLPITPVRRQHGGDFPTLFSPLRINTMMTKNRIVATPTGDFFEDKALGGAGIVIAGHAIVEPGRSSYSSGDEPDAFAKYQREETRRRILKIHQAGARASIEIFHGGEFARVKDFARGPVSKTRDDGAEVRGMTVEDMAHVADLFGEKVREAQELGFDMVFLHFGHGWLPAQFLSPRNNRRTDDYGGSLQKRARFPLQILEAVRAAAGTHFPVDMRISAKEFMEDSIEFSDVLEFLRMAEPLLDTVQISAGVDIGLEGNVHCATTNFEERMPNAGWAAEVKKALSIPVSVVGAIMNPADAEELIASGAVDMVALGRPLIADPDWPRKAQEGRADEIVPCIRCLQCYHISTERKKVGCSVNPRFWNESFVPREIGRARTRRRLVIVGGGPAGITGALAGVERGHEVILLEKEDEVGGQLQWIAREHYKEDLRDYDAYLRRQITRSAVDVRTGIAATPELVAELEPDALLIAIGAHEFIPMIDGANLPHVLTGSQAIEHESSVGQRVAIVGAGQIGAEIGLELALLHGRDVTLVDRGTTFAKQGNILYREGLRQKLESAESLSIRYEAAATGITPSHLEIRTRAGHAEEIPADTVILAAGMRARKDEAHAYYGIVPEVAMAGDCVRPRIIQDAVFEASMFARNI